MCPAIRRPSARNRLAGWASPAAGVGGLAAVSMVTNDAGAFMVVAVTLCALRLVVAVVLAVVASRIALRAAADGQDPDRLIRSLVSFLRALR